MARKSKKQIAEEARIAAILEHKAALRDLICKPGSAELTVRRKADGGFWPGRGANWLNGDGSPADYQHEHVRIRVAMPYICDDGQAVVHKNDKARTLIHVDVRDAVTTLRKAGYDAVVCLTADLPDLLILDPDVVLEVVDPGPMPGDIPVEGVLCHAFAAHPHNKPLPQAVLYVNGAFRGAMPLCEACKARWEKDHAEPDLDGEEADDEATEDELVDA